MACSLIAVVRDMAVTASRSVVEVQRRVYLAFFVVGSLLDVQGGANEVFAA